MRVQGIRSLVAAVSSVLAVGLIVAAGSQPGELTAVPMAPVVQPSAPLSVSTAQPDLPGISDEVRAPVLEEAEGAEGASGSSGALRSMVPAPTMDAPPEEPPGEDTIVLTRPSSVPTVPIPSVARTKSGTLLSMPIQGRKTSRFGMRFHPVRHVWKLHTGLDLAAPCGTPVGAAAAGTVVRAGWAGGNGTQVKVDHGMLAGHRVITTYNHLSAIGVQVGQKVEAHQGVGRVGTTGFSTGCHLHFEVIADGQFTNPEPWLDGTAVVVDTAAMGAGKPGGPGTTNPPSSSSAPPTSSSSSLPSAPPSTPGTSTPVTPTPSTVPVVPPTTKPVVPPTTEPVVPPTTEPVVPPTTEPVVPPTTEPVVPPTTEPVVPPTTEPVVPPTTEPVVPPTTEPVVPPTTEPVVPPTTEPVVPPTTEPVVPPTTKPVVPPTTEPVVPPTTKPVVPPTTKPVVPPTTEPVAPPTTKSVVPPTTQPVDPPTNS